MTKPKPLWHGTLLVTGGAVGAGMFALPMVSAGPWMLWSTAGFILVWLMTYLAASLFAKVNIALVAQNHSGLDYQSSFNALVKHTLGPRWAAINNISILFIMMILMYAYTSAGASIVSYSLESIGIDTASDARSWLSLAFASIIALVVWLGTSLVSQVMLLLMVAMAFTFGIATFGVLPSVDLVSLTTPTNTFIYLFGALPVYVTAFACAGLVPSLVRHYKTQPQNVNRSILAGTGLALLIYLFWLVVTLGSVGREGLVSVITDGGNLDDLVKAMVNVGANPAVQSRLNLFSHCAIVTSFLSVSLGLLHFIQDRLSLGNSASQRLVAAVVCFAPPALASFLLPYGFVHAISYAGMFVAFSFFILPGVMAAVTSRKTQTTEYGILPNVIIGFGCLVLLLKFALVLSILPKFI